MTASDTQTFAIAKPIPRTVHRVNVAARFREVAALEMAGIRAREDQDIQQVRERAKQDLAYWQLLLDQVEETAPDSPAKAGRAPYEATTEVLHDLSEVAFPGEPDLCDDPAAVLGRIAELHDELAVEEAAS